MSPDDAYQPAKVRSFPRNVLTHLFMPAPFVMRQPFLESLREQSRVKVLRLRLLLKQRTNLSKVNAEVVDKLMKVEQVSAL